MKTSKRFLGLHYLLILLVALTFIHCEQDNDPEPEEKFHHQAKPDKKGPKIASKSDYIPGTDITHQLREDLNAGLDVTLPAGRFYVSESIIVEGYSGTLKGAGKEATTIENTPYQPFRAMEDTLFGPDFPLTEILAFYWSKGDLTIKDLTIKVSGEAPAELHNNPFYGNLSTIDNAIVVVGTDEESDGIVVSIKNIKVVGEVSLYPYALNEKNMVHPIVVGGAFGSGKPVSTRIMDCEVVNCGANAVEYFDAFGGTGVIKNNTFQDCIAGPWMGYWMDPLDVLGELTVKDNVFTNMTYYAIGNWGIWSSYCIKNNIEDGEFIPDNCE